MSEVDASFLAGHIGRVVAGKFQLVSVLGCGGMGAVFKARHTTLETHVALKLLLSDDQEAHRRFDLEAAALARIDHRNVVRVIDFGREPDGAAYLVMEHVTGIDLRALVASQGALPLERVVALGSDVLLGLAAVHDVGVVHRDLKPGNILLTKRTSDNGHIEEGAKLADFGIAEYLDAGRQDAAPWLGPREAFTETGYIVGTPEYMSPEQVQGHRLSRASDLYSVGVMLYELATAVRPYRGRTALEIAVQHMSAPIPLPSSLVRVPPAFDAFCMRALCKDADLRFTDARSMRRALLEVLSPGVDRGEASTISASVFSPISSEVVSLGEATTQQAVAITGEVTGRDYAGRRPARASYAARVLLVACGALAALAVAGAIHAGGAGLAGGAVNAATGPRAARGIVVRSTDAVESAQGGDRVASASPGSGVLAAGGDRAAGVAPATLPNTAPTVADALAQVRRALGSVTRSEAGPGLAAGDLATEANRARQLLEQCTKASATSAASPLRPGDLGEMIARFQVSPEGHVLRVTFDDARWPEAARACAQRALVGLYLPHALPTATNAMLGFGLILQ